MQKPQNKAAKDFIIEKVSKDLEIAQDVVETVISWAFKKANEATRSNNEVELSGIGKLQLSQSKVRRQIEMLEKIYSRMSEEERLLQISTTIADLKTKQCLTK